MAKLKKALTLTRDEKVFGLFCLLFAGGMIVSWKWP